MRDLHVLERIVGLMFVGVMIIRMVTQNILLRLTHFLLEDVLGLKISLVGKVE
jgi:hypothetical protein